MDSNAALLVDIPLFSKLPPDMLAHLASVARDVEIAAGQVLFRDGDPGDTLYVLKTGRVEVLVDEQVVRSHGRGELPALSAVRHPEALASLHFRS